MRTLDVNGTASPPLEAPQRVICWKSPQLTSDHSGGRLPATLIAAHRTAARPCTYPDTWIMLPEHNNYLFPVVGVIMSCRVLWMQRVSESIFRPIPIVSHFHSSPMAGDVHVQGYRPQSAICSRAGCTVTETQT
jgi:hypothetical protein